MIVKLYRAVSGAELAQTLSTGLAVVANSLEGKWFAESISDAEQWGTALTRLGGIPQHRIIEVVFPSDVADRFFRLPMLDGIGPARFATPDDFEHVISIREVTRWTSATGR